MINTSHKSKVILTGSLDCLYIREKKEHKGRLLRLQFKNLKFQNQLETAQFLNLSENLLGNELFALTIGQFWRMKWKMSLSSAW